MPSAVPQTVVAHGQTTLPFANRGERYVCKLHGGTLHIPLSAAVKFAHATLSGWRMAGINVRKRAFQPFVSYRLYMTASTHATSLLIAYWISHTIQPCRLSTLCAAEQQ